MADKGVRNDGRDSRGRWLVRPPGATVVQKGQVLNPYGCQAPAVIESRKVLNQIGKWFALPEVRARLKKYIVEDCPPGDLVKLALAMSEKEHMKQRVLESAALLGITMSHLADVIREGGSPEANEIAAAIEGEVIEDRASPPPKPVKRTKPKSSKTSKKPDNSAKKGEKRNTFADIGL